MLSRALCRQQGFMLPRLPAHDYQGRCSAPFQHMRLEEFVCFVPYERGLDVPQTKQKITWWGGNKSRQTHSMYSKFTCTKVHFCMMESYKQYSRTKYSLSLSCVECFNYDCCKIIRDTIMTHIAQYRLYSLWNDKELWNACARCQFGLKRWCKSIPRGVQKEINSSSWKICIKFGMCIHSNVIWHILYESSDWMSMPNTTVMLWEF